MKTEFSSVQEMWEYLFENPCVKTTPLTVIELDTIGRKISSRVYLDGIRDGLTEKWEQPSGEKTEEINFKGGKLHGPCTFWKNGYIVTQGVYINGEEDFPSFNTRQFNISYKNEDELEKIIFAYIENELCVIRRVDTSSSTTVIGYVLSFKSEEDLYMFSKDYTALLNKLNPNRHIPIDNRPSLVQSIIDYIFPF